MRYHLRRLCSPFNRVVNRLLWQWTENAERTDGTGMLLAECDNGEFWLPSKSRPDRWDRRASLLRPTSWRAYLNSRRRNELVAVEGE